MKTYVKNYSVSILSSCSVEVTVAVVGFFKVRTPKKCNSNSVEKQGIAQNVKKLNQSFFNEN